MRLVFPNATRINRGSTVMREMSEACRTNDYTDLIVLHEHRGQPGKRKANLESLSSLFPTKTGYLKSLPSTDAMVVSHFPHGPTTMFTLHNVVLRHDITSHTTSTVSEQYPHLIFEGFSSNLGTRIQNILKYLFPVPREESKRVMTFQNDNDFISFRHHVFVKNSHKEVELAEVGPRFQMRRELIPQIPSFLSVLLGRLISR